MLIVTVCSFGGLLGILHPSCKVCVRILNERVYLWEIACIEQEMRLHSTLVSGVLNHMWDRVHGISV